MSSSGGAGPSAPSTGSLPGAEEERAAVAAIALQPLYGLVGLVGLSGNGLVIFVLLRRAAPRPAASTYLLNLAVADTLFLLSLPFVSAAAALRRWPFGPALCRAVLGAAGLAMFASVFGLAALSVDRYLAVAHPPRAGGRSPRQARLVSAGVWLAALLACSPLAAFPGPEACGLHGPRPARSAASVLYTFSLGFVLPALAVGLCHLGIVGQVRAAALRAGWRGRRSEGRLTRLVLAVGAVFVLCWLPFYVVQLAGLLGPRLGAAPAHVALLLSYAHSCANPILYSLLSARFRRSCQGAFAHRPCCCRSRSHSGHPHEAVADERGMAEKEEEEEPLDYYINALKGKAEPGPTPPLPRQPEDPEPGGGPGTLTSTTAF
ncbi:somatostatin receptor type 4 [Tachyglossus aculeatus]|uniref:somatostatin receptor type 4 n=1 Tax=Tachyglossus aculeatus TaxID=9261 RepID=UPI0018F6A12E|nr:somatostatin receptor type 4 [Tachyglossus aculeatus]